MRATADSRHVRAYVLGAALTILLAGSGRLTLTTPVSTTLTGTFDVRRGPAGRREFAFPVDLPGPIRIRVASETHEPLAVMVWAGTINVSATRVPGAGDVSVFATPALVAAAREWAVTIHPYAVGVETAGHLRVEVPQGEPYRARHEVDGWLAAHPAAARHLTWRDANGVHTYSAWSRTMQERLWALVDTARGTAASAPGSGLANPPAAGDDDACEFYLATVARTLVRQMETHAPSPAADLNEDALEALFSSRSVLSPAATRLPPG